MEYITLNNGVKMPMAGLGTFMLSPQDAENAVCSALTVGYPLIDTANGYMNERGTARGIRKSSMKREDIFLVTKLWPSVYEDENAIEDTLARLDTDYIDLLFLHQPVGAYLKGYRMIEKAYKEGKVKAIGLSNFPDDRFQQILDECEIIPQVAQVEAHPYFPQTDLKEKFLIPNDIALMAWFPLGHGDKSLIQEPVFAELSAKYGKSPAQVILRWHIQMGHIIIPGSKNPAHIKDNIDIFDFALTEEEMAAIAQINKNTRYYNMPIEEAEARYTSIRPDFNAQEQNIMKKTWLITGCSAGGIGAGIARQVLEKGHNVAVTARNTDKVQDIVKDFPDTALALALDITDDASIDAAVKATVEHFGTIDVLVNNAGYCYRSSIEEAEDAGVRLMYETNLFGPIHLIQRVLPYMRAQQSGAIVNVSSIGAVRTGAASGFYASTKAALELMSDGLRAELAPLGIKVMVVEPGAFRTHFYDSSLKGSANTIDAYKDTAWTRSVAQNVNKQNQPGDPRKAGEPIMQALESDNTPFRLLLGSDAVKVVRGALEGRLKEIDAWEEVSGTTDF